MPSPLKRIQENLIPEGERVNLLIKDTWLADNYEPHSLGVEFAVIDGEYEGFPVTDYLHIQEKDGELYISRKGKLYPTLRNALNVKEFNALVDKLDEVPVDRDVWIELIAEALKEAEYPAISGVVEENNPEDPANKRNKLSKDSEDIRPYTAPDFSNLNG